MFLFLFLSFGRTWQKEPVLWGVNRPYEYLPWFPVFSEYDSLWRIGFQFARSGLNFDASFTALVVTVFLRGKLTRYGCEGVSSL